MKRLLGSLAPSQILCPGLQLNTLFIPLIYDDNSLFLLIISHLSSSIIQGLVLLINTEMGKNVILEPKMQPGAFHY
ncbi:hypothetical protein CK203_085309 [Vitis vinifera]|uniref:Uncharacterized protein n=1 Tax=Vitis vinifera TaxID=29760 RepID=A0A438DCX9_VITVI|nr:hypothetical protein CK203_085309 [Vitis vinifera]